MGWIAWIPRVGGRYVPAATTPATTTSTKHTHTTPHCYYYTQLLFLGLACLVSNVSLRLAGLASSSLNCSFPILSLACNLESGPTTPPLLALCYLLPFLYYRWLLPQRVSSNCVPPPSVPSALSGPPPPPRALASITPVSSPLAPPASTTARSKRERSSEGGRDNQRMWR